MIRIIIFVLVATTASSQIPSEVIASTSTTQEIGHSRQSSQTSASYLRRPKKPRERYLIEGITSGVWVPRGNDRALGVYPSLGYWGFECLYNNVWYKNPGGTPLDGGGITFRFTVGGIRGL